ncbi:MAG: apolipoprotein N-acyltransferase [Planctomycetota bacterium]
MRVHRRVLRAITPEPVAVPVGIAAGLALYLSFPPHSFFPASVLAVVLPAWVASTTRRPLRAAVWVAAGHAWVWLVWHWWVRDVSPAGLIGLVPYLSAYLGVFVGVGAWVVQRSPAGRLTKGIALAGLFSTVEWLRTDVVLTGYAFYAVGDPWIDWAPTAALGTAVGAAGVSTLVALFGALIGVLVGKGGHSRVPAGCGAAAAGFVLVAGGAIVQARPSRAGQKQAGEALTLGLIQTNVPQSVRGGWGVQDRLDAYDQAIVLTGEAVEAGAEVVVWPETMFPGAELNDEAAAVIDAAGLGLQSEQGFLPLGVFRERLLDRQRALGVPMVVGARAANGLRVRDVPFAIEADARFNSAFVIGDGFVQARYDKSRLVPFGETLPYVDGVPWLEELVLSVGVGAAGMAFDLDAGKEPGTVGLVVPPRTEPIHVATPICFEITEAGYLRRLVSGADPSAALVLNLSNDGWFGSSDAGREVHLLSARWRAVEIGRPVARAANTGITAVIAADGTVTDRLSPGEPGVLVADVPIAAEHGNAYTAGGYWFRAWSWLAAGIGTGRCLKLRRERKVRRG